MNSCYIAVPAYNEESSIESLIFDISAYVPSEHIVVVDDGSQDETAKRAGECGATVLSHKRNFGKGRAIQTAIQYGIQHGYQWVVFMDADLQHPPSFLPYFMLEIDKGRADVILANRTDRFAQMPIHRQLSNGITSIMISLIAGTRIHDSQCGYRAICLRHLQKIEFSETGFQLESEMLIKLGQAGACFREIPIQTVYANENSSIDPIRDTLQFIKLFIKSLSWH